MENIIVTRHAAKRMKERSGLNKKSVQRIADRAYNQGHTYMDVNGSLKRWILKRAYTTDKPSDIRLYGDKAYIFHNKRLITVIQIPSRFSDWQNRRLKQSCA